VRNNLRRKKDLIDIPFRTLMWRRHVVIAGPYVWNSLPDHIKASHSVLTFKRKLTDHLLRQSLGI